MKNIKGIIVAFFLILVIIIFYSFSDIGNFKFGKDSDKVRIGLALPVKLLEDNCLLFEGIEMAANEINQNGGILGKELEMVIENDDNNVTKALSVAEKFASDKTINGVIGHWSSNCTISTAQIYDTNDMILISPISTAPSLTEQGYSKLFRNTTTDEEVAIALTDYSNSSRYENIAIYYGDTEYGRNFADYVEKRCSELKINVVDRHSYFLNKQEFDATYKKWEYLNVSAVFIADTITDVRELVYWIREKDNDMPIIGGDGFDIEKFKEYMRQNSENIMYASFLNNREDNTKYKEFVSKFKEIYGKEPDYWAIKAYDSVYLFKTGMEAAGSSEDSEKIADALKNIDVIHGINGDYSFDEKGNMLGDEIGIKHVVDGNYQYLFDY